MTGYVRKIFLEKGFAFVEGSDERDYFLHWSKVSRNSVPFRNIKENDKVSFEFEEGTNGPKAFNVLVIRSKSNGRDSTESRPTEVRSEGSGDSVDTSSGNHSSDSPSSGGTTVGDDSRG